MTSLNQLLKRLETIALGHRQINHFYFGDPVEWLSNGEVRYPACFVDVTSSTIAEKQNRFVVEIWIADLTNVSADARGNETEVMSDLTLIAEDIYSMLRYSGYEDDWTIDETAPLGFFREKFEDWTAAVRMTVGIGINFLSDRCRVPSELTFETDKEMKLVHNYTYTGLGSEEDSLTIASLLNKEILLLLKGDKVLVRIGDDDEISSANEFKYASGTGLFEFGNDIEEGQVLQILYRNI